ncbi:RNA-binding protein [Bacillus aquiflavi]|uniref:RNA-binding protein n=1 Tax=Bacillus aquiflavi TaxID=2672567 RepID=A0A6B3VUB1_9BACI|nr:RNA-binding protein [Bacillus aquiflavi]MBA4537593.1 RNA-binding protein [Bacillus aquiflavi]NEY81850.1 RNA-binding protein [Bacillus aquiflavi]UAC49319.1 RNA-binding protein [Bacillus aquiflavi]
MSIYQHFRQEEKEFIDQVIQWRTYVENAYAQKLTDFLDPREQHILQAMIGTHSNVKWELFGGTDDSERKRALLYPEYLPIEKEDFHITLFQIDYPKKFISIEHRHVLGSLMSLGLKRGKFGDILLNGDNVQFFAAEGISEYIQMELRSIGKAAVTLKKIPLYMAIQEEKCWKEHSITVSSLRVDSVISSMFRISRQKSQLYVQQGLVKVNWTVISQASFICEEGDIISVRGGGRGKVLSIDGKTKKEKWRMIVGIQK